MLIYNGVHSSENWYKNDANITAIPIRKQPVERATSVKRIKLTAKNKKFLKSLGLKV